ncbi:MAG TPA: hypothetical protein PLG34_07930 [Spirochaetota bacterium]|nr:MAG: Neutral metalloprotease precursor [Spirochaetes bacterium ADurb.Bin133]HNZ27670.1 hypothetical protein [Spirochaetota bacterium]HPY87897.1 hypothetical protein [Spirochaetota bacterium]HQB60877.1 hypothetical protein [Spirochaetota bacterium]
MNFKNFVYLLIFALIAFTLNSCGFLFPIDEVVEINYIDESASNVATANRFDVFHVETTSDYVNLKYKISNLYNNDVYFIFTNVSVDSSRSNPTVDASYSTNDAPVNSVRNTEDINELRVVDNYKVKEFNQNPSKFIDFDKIKSDNGRFTSRTLLNDYVGASQIFYTTNSTTEGVVRATCRSCREVTTDMNKTKTLSIYVADNCWKTAGATAKSFYVTKEMVETLAAKFLSAGPGNDIYDWVTGIYGEEWGAHDNRYYIEPNDNITILLCDIEEDDVPKNSIVMGYFHSKDSLIKTEQTGFSNQRIMFYIDAVMFANHTTADGKPGDGVWQITDYWPQSTISVLSHEFQHMIHFYQKFILNKLQRSSEIWLEEMCSLVTEDFVSNKIGANGPRGVNYYDPTHGSPGNIYGRLPLYNEYDDDSVSTWLTGDDVLRSYSSSYSYGAYLARNYGGVGFFKLIVQSPFTDYRAIDDALAKSGYSDDFFKTLQNWGAAVILSDLAASEPYRYNSNNAAWMTSDSDKGVSYELGSINLYNYTRNGQVGPYIYKYSPVGLERKLRSLNSSSNRFYLVSKNAGGTLERTIKLDKNVKLTVVKK